jgi:hypothetical protein
VCTPSPVGVSVCLRNRSMNQRHTRTHIYDQETHKDTHMRPTRHGTPETVTLLNTHTKKRHVRVEDERRRVRGSAGDVIHIRRRPVEDTPCQPLHYVRPSVFFVLPIRPHTLSPLVLPLTMKTSKRYLGQKQSTHTHTHTHTRAHRWLKSAGERERELGHMAAP